MAEHDTIGQRLRELGAFCNGIIPSHFSGYEPTPEDAREITNDLRLLMERVKTVFAAYGEHCNSYGALSQDDLKYLSDVFDDGMSEWTSLIENGVDERLEYNREAEYDKAEHDYRLNRETVS